MLLFISFEKKSKCYNFHTNSSIPVSTLNGIIHHLWQIWWKQHQPRELTAQICRDRTVRVPIVMSSILFQQKLACPTAFFFGSGAIELPIVTLSILFQQWLNCYPDNWCYQYFFSRDWTAILFILMLSILFQYKWNCHSAYCDFINIVSAEIELSNCPLWCYWYFSADAEL